MTNHHRSLWLLVAWFFAALAVLALGPGCGIFPPNPPTPPTPPPACPETCPPGEICLDPAAGCVPDPDATPARGVPVGPERLLRPSGTTVLVGGEPFGAVMVVPCCMAWTAPTLWPLASEAWMDPLLQA